MRYRFLLIAMTFFLLFFINSVQLTARDSLHRDIPGEKPQYCASHYLINSNEEGLRGRGLFWFTKPEEQLGKQIVKLLSFKLLRLIPPYYSEKNPPPFGDRQYIICNARGKHLETCTSPRQFPGYVNPNHVKYINHLKQQLEYYNLHQECRCYWPEYSEKASKINNLAYRLFEHLIEDTALVSLTTDDNEQKLFIKNQRSFETDELVCSLVTQQFRFSDYYHVYRDIELMVLS